MNVLAAFAATVISSMIQSVGITTLANQPERKAIVKEKLGFNSVDEFMRASYEEIVSKR